MTYVCQYPEIAEELIQLKGLDLQLRNQLLEEGTLFEGYHPEMEQRHIQNGRRLHEIIQEIGWPNQSKVGIDGAEAAWLILQHAISLPDLQRDSLPLLEVETEKDEIQPYQYAHLLDRIRFFERKPQRFGTQLDWDEHGDMSPWKLESEVNVNTLREKVGLPPIEVEVERIRKELTEQNVTMPTTYEERTREINEWRKRVGWV